MTDAVLMVVVVGVIALTLAVDLAALIGWLRKREARHNEAGRKSTRTGKHDVGINRQRWSQVEGPRGTASRVGSQPWVGARGGAFAVWSCCRRIRPIWWG